MMAHSSGGRIDQVSQGMQGFQDLIAHTQRPSSAPSCWPAWSAPAGASMVTFSFRDAAKNKIIQTTRRLLSDYGCLLNTLDPPDARHLAADKTKHPECPAKTAAI